MQKTVICWLLQATFTQVLSCLFRINHKDWLFSSESFEKYREPNCGFIPRHDCSTGQEWMWKQGKGNTQTLTNRSGDVQNAKWTGAQKKKPFLTYLACTIFFGGKAITVNLWMRRWEWGRCGKNGIWNLERVFKKTPENHATSSIWYCRWSTIRK